MLHHSGDNGHKLVCSLPQLLVFKKGSPSDPSNYRPISLTCVACKLLEAGIKVNLLNHLAKNNVISRHQDGFLSRKSTTTQLLKCCTDWQIVLNERHQMDIIQGVPIKNNPLEKNAVFQPW